MDADAFKTVCGRRDIQGRKPDWHPKWGESKWSKLAEASLGEVDLSKADLAMLT